MNKELLLKYLKKDLDGNLSQMARDIKSKHEDIKDDSERVRRTLSRMRSDIRAGIDPLQESEVDQDRLVIITFLRENKTLTHLEAARVLKKNYNQFGKKTVNAIKHMVMSIREDENIPQEEKEYDPIHEIETHQHKIKIQASEKEKRVLVSQLSLYKERYDVAMEVKDYKPHYQTFELKKGDKRQGVIVKMLSDVHCEENVKPETCNYKNHLNLDISDMSLHRDRVNSTKVANDWAGDMQVEELILWVGGDLIHGDMSKAWSGDNFLKPKDAILWMLDRLCTTIKYYLDNTKFKVSVVFSVGNHGRSTKELQNEILWETAWEAMLYDLVVKEWRNEERVQFPTYHNKSYFSTLDIFGYQVRFHHGNAIRHHGSIGGPLTGANKAIMQWNSEIEDHVHYDVHGHFHSLGLDAPQARVISNGSVVGYNPYSIFGKFRRELPMQGMFMIDSQVGKTLTAPVLIRKYENGQTIYL